MFKMIMDKVHNPHRSKKKELKIRDIVDYMDELVRQYIPEEAREPADLVSELVKKGIG
jgi:hypothetical protein